MSTTESKNVRKLTESAILVAAAVVLSLITLFKMPLGGSVTPFSTLPIVLIGLRHGSKWGVAGALVYSVTQLMLGMGNVLAVPVKTAANLVMCAALDYVVAYTILGFTGSLAKKLNNNQLGLCAAICITGLGRLASSFLSGVIIWAPYAPEGWSVAGYSLAYNASWCLPDVAIVLVACLALSRVRALKLLPS